MTYLVDSANFVKTYSNQNVAVAHFTIHNIQVQCNKIFNTKMQRVYIYIYNNQMKWGSQTL